MDENKLLKSVNLKSTKKRLLILSILNNTHSPLCPEEILDIASSEINLNLSTVYRALSALTEKGILLKENRSDGKAYYQINNQKHKHQLVCSLCQKVVTIHACPLHKFESDLSESSGFTITGHNLEFYGICPDCAKEL